MIKLSAFSDEACEDLHGQIDALLANGIYLTEIRSIGGVNVKNLEFGDAARYAAELSAAGIGVSAIGSPIGKVDVDVDPTVFASDVRHICELARLFGTNRVRVFSFFHAYSKRNLVLERLRQAVEIAGEYGLTLYHENEKDIYGDTAARVLDLQESVKGLQFVYDPANFLQVGESPDATLRTVLPICSHFHIKDVDAKSGELVPAGLGSAKIGEFLKRLPKDAILTLEPHLRVFSGYAKLDGTPMKHRFHFNSGREAFDFAANALKRELLAAGRSYEKR